VHENWWKTCSTRSVVHTGSNSAYYLTVTALSHPTPEVTTEGTTLAIEATLNSFRAQNGPMKLPFCSSVMRIRRKYAAAYRNRSQPTPSDRGMVTCISYSHYQPPSVSTTTRRRHDNGRIQTRRIAAVVFTLRLTGG
jgi:hypothetical protein